MLREKVNGNASRAHTSLKEYNDISTASHLHLHCGITWCYNGVLHKPSRVSE